MIKLHPEIIEKDGKKQFVMLPYEEYLAIEEALADAEDLSELRAAKKEEQDAPSIPSGTGRRRLGTLQGQQLRIRAVDWREEVMRRRSELRRRFDFARSAPCPGTPLRPFLMPVFQTVVEVDQNADPSRVGEDVCVMLRSRGDAPGYFIVHLRRVELTRAAREIDVRVRAPAFGVPRLRGFFKIEN